MPESEDWIDAIINGLKFLKEISTVTDQQGKFTYCGNVNRDLALHLLPIDSLLEYGLHAENMEINLLTLQIIGVFYSGFDAEQVAQFSQVVPDAVIFISANFLMTFCT